MICDTASFAVIYVMPAVILVHLVFYDTYSTISTISGYISCDNILTPDGLSLSNRIVQSVTNLPPHR